MSEKLLSSPEAMMNILRRIAVAAGEITLEYFEDCGFDEAECKADGSPVTIADKEAEKHIEAELSKLMPNVPIIGEEAFSEGSSPDITDARYFFLVDALDGTKSFIAGEDSYTVNIALIRDGKPFIGVVYAPVCGHLYAGFYEDEENKKAICFKEDSDTEKNIRVRTPPEKGLTIIQSSRHSNGPRTSALLEHFKIEKEMRIGSSLKMCLIAAGKVDLYPRLDYTCEWDTAAAHAILRAAGGYIRDIENNELTYGGHDPKFLNPEFLAWGFEPFEIELD